MLVRAVVTKPIIIPLSTNPTRNQTIDIDRASFERGAKSPYLK